tara:strand:- start:114858 stop:115706 length:849 start_codon:yes stop_codon:yes gene_type:complete
VSYADFITILLAFFVVMYSISSVNEGKYQVLSDSLGTAFGGTPAPRLDTLSMLDASGAASSEAEASTSSILIPLLLEHQQGAQAQDEAYVEDPNTSVDSQSFSEKVLNKAEREIDAIATDVEGEMEDLIDDELINIKRNKFWLEVEVKSSLLFSSGSSALLPASIPVMIDLADIFADLPNRINVEGYTDDIPISTLAFPSNWELSAARAAAVVRLFESNGVDPSRLASIGYGQYHAIADNESEEGRAKNRRVVMIVMASLENESDRVYEFELLKEQAQGLAE